MLIQLQPQHLAIIELELELLAIELRIVLVDNAMVVGTDDNDVRGVVVLRTGEVVDMVGLDNAVSILVTNLLTANLITIVVELLQGQDDTAVNTTQRALPKFLVRCESVSLILWRSVVWVSSLRIYSSFANKCRAISINWSAS